MDLDFDLDVDVDVDLDFDLDLDLDLDPLRLEFGDEGQLDVIELREERA